MNTKAIVVSPANDVLALRPATDASLKECKAAKVNILIKKAECIARLAEVKAKRTEYLLESSGDDLLAMDREIAVLKITIEQAEALLPILDDRIDSQGQKESNELLQDMRDKLAIRRATFPQRFFERYSAIEKQFYELEAELKAINDETDSFNAGVSVLEKRFKSSVSRLTRRIVHSDYLNLLSLPKLRECENLAEQPGIGYRGSGLINKRAGYMDLPDTESLYDLIELDAG